MDAGTVMQQFSALISPEMIPVIAAVFGVCFALKRASFFDDRFIPLAALLLGVLFEVALAATITRVEIVGAATRGIVCGLAAVYVANIVKQARS
ncbi:MAG: phage holin family protein [Clostridia bacterium]